MTEEQLLSDKDWDRIRRAMDQHKEEVVSRTDLQTRYRVRVTVEILPQRTAAVRGHDMVLTVSRTFPNGNTSVQNFDTVNDARRMLYG